jgi:hypothetical protein
MDVAWYAIENWVLDLISAMVQAISLVVVVLVILVIVLE